MQTMIGDHLVFLTPQQNMITTATLLDMPVNDFHIEVLEPRITERISVLLLSKEKPVYQACVVFATVYVHVRCATIQT